MAPLAMSPDLADATLAPARPLRVRIAGGGTGGHLFPGIALAEQVVAAGGEVRFVGTERGIEARTVPELGYELDRIEVSGIKGRGIKGLIAGVLRLPRAWLQSRRIIKNFRPDVVVGVGGYASGPIVATAWLMRRPTAILEHPDIAEAAVLGLPHERQRAGRDLVPNGMCTCALVDGARWKVARAPARNAHCGNA